MNNLEKIERAIRLALPELMKISEGCEVQFNKHTYDCKATIVAVDRVNEECHLLFGNGPNCYVKFHSLDFVKRKSTTIYNPVTLLHLLRWLGTFNYIRIGNNFLCESLTLKENGDINAFIKFQLDITKPLIRDQSHDVINEIVKIIH